MLTSLSSPRVITEASDPKDKLSPTVRFPLVVTAPPSAIVKATSPSV